MKLSGTVNDYVRPRWSRWLAELCRSKHMSADVLRTNAANRDTAPRAALASWVTRQRTVSAANAFFVGQRISATPKLKHYGDPCVALYAAGYLSVAAACLELTINRALADYPDEAIVKKTGAVDFRHPVVRKLTYALTAAVHLPFALAHLDAIPNSVISPDARAEHLERILYWSQVQFFDDAWKRSTSQSGAQPKHASDATGLTLADQEALAWTGLINRLSRRARGNPLLQHHFSVLRQRVDEYQQLVFSVPHLT